MTRRCIQDGTYAVWEQMQRAKVVPNHMTQRMLAGAFGNNTQLATALVLEAYALQASSHYLFAPLQLSVSLDLLGCAGGGP